MISKDKYRSRLKVDDLVAQILELKQIPLDDAYNILYDQDKIINIDETNEIININEAASLFVDCLKQGRDIFVYADYDVDGMTSGTIMKRFLAQFKNYSEVYFPERSDGYGLSIDFIEKINERYKCQLKPLVITVDNGITKVEETELCKKYNIPIIITDHHLPQKVLPDTIIVDQHITESDHWAKALCGAEVALYFCRAIERALGYNYYHTNKLIYLASIGAIADVMPMASIVNQAIVQKGFKQINEGNVPNTLRQFVKNMGSPRMNSEFVSWDLAPRLNSCARLFDIKSSIELLDISEDAEDICNNVEAYNNQRKELTKEYTDIIKKAYNESYDENCNIALVALDYAPLGILGILAGKLEDYSGLPSFVGIDDQEQLIHGSARSNSYPLNVLLANDENVYSFGGHAAACGFAIYNDKVEEFKQSLTDKINELNKHAVVESVRSKPEELIYFTLSDLTKEAYNSFYLFAYDNVSFEKPKICIKDLTITSISISKNNGKNIKYTLFDGKKQIDFWHWGAGDLGFRQGDRVRIIGDITKNFMKPKLYTLRIDKIVKEE